MESLCSNVLAAVGIFREHGQMPKPRHSHRTARASTQGKNTEAEVLQAEGTEANAAESKSRNREKWHFICEPQQNPLNVPVSQ